MVHCCHTWSTRQAVPQKLTVNVANRADESSIHIRTQIISVWHRHLPADVPPSDMCAAASPCADMCAAASPCADTADGAAGSKEGAVEHTSGLCQHVEENV
jgi:hypothetical protein